MHMFTGWSLLEVGPSVHHLHLIAGSTVSTVKWEGGRLIRIDIIMETTSV